MRYLALATDYDGTLAHDGRVDDSTLAALERLLATGRKLVLVTGRELPDLLQTFPRVNLFEWLVVENGALLYRPSTKEEKLLASAPPERFVQMLHERGVAPLSTGKAIVATWHPHESAVLEVIRDLGLDSQVIFNKDAVMVLPAGVNKATGLRAALDEMGLSPHNVVGIGDAENDHAFLRLCECAVAVANALPMVKDTADFTTQGERGVGVTELIDAMLANDLESWEGRLERHHILIGTRADGSEVRIKPYGFNLLIVGASGGGKSTLTTGLLERLVEAEYQFCVIDPEGDYDTFEDAAILGTPQRAPSVDEVLNLLKVPADNVIANLVGLSVTERPRFFLGLLPQLLEMRARTGRPHWLIVDETHHLLPASWEPGLLALPEKLTGMVRITTEPRLLSPPALANIDTFLAVGDAAHDLLRDFCQIRGETPPPYERAPLKSGEALYWPRATRRAPEYVRITPSRSYHRRHSRKYVEGELPPERSFYFRGPENKLNLRAQNLITFMQIGDGVDDDTWLYHLRRGNYSDWFREAIKDETLAEKASEVAHAQDLDARASRARIREAIERQYTLPAASPMPMPGTNAEKPP